MSINVWMDKQVVVDSDTALLISSKKEWTSDTCSNMDEPQNNYVEWKSDKKKYIFYDSFYVKF